MKLKLGVIGCGSKASQYIETWIQRADIEIYAVADPSEKALEFVDQIAIKSGYDTPKKYIDWRNLLAEKAEHLDLIYICTPHASHAEQALAALELGLDVLLEKPMVTTVEEAQSLRNAQQRSGKTLVIAYQGGLSPLVHQLRDDIKNNTYGDLISVTASIWENWADTYKGHWKQQIEISGGGFMFDTGAHMMNTVSMLCDQPYKTVSAKMAKHGFPVDIATAVMAELNNGTLMTMHACGKSIRCTSRIEFYFTNYVVRICAWGRWLEVEDENGNITRKEQESANNLMNVFMQTVAGDIENPSDVNQGVLMAQLWDAIKASAQQGGLQIQCDNT